MIKLSFSNFEYTPKNRFFVCFVFCFCANIVVRSNNQTDIYSLDVVFCITVSNLGDILAHIHTLLRNIFNIQCMPVPTI